MSSGVKRPAMRGPTAGVAFTVSIVHDNNATDVHNEFIPSSTSTVFMSQLLAKAVRHDTAK